MTRSPPDASDPGGLQSSRSSLTSTASRVRRNRKYTNAVMGAPDRLLEFERRAPAGRPIRLSVISFIVLTQAAAPAMRAAGSGTIIVTGGGFADYPIPALATISLGKAALRSAATMLGADLEPDSIRVATPDSRRADRCRYRLRSREHRKALLGGRQFRWFLAGGVSHHRPIGLRTCGNPPVTRGGAHRRFCWVLLAPVVKKKEGNLVCRIRKCSGRVGSGGGRINT